ncbi:DVUA0089 family protein [Candidatus Trichorickettsia mobilis]|uniref:DVUA0089 family protein n=1 Tax=Candidatus Trichorickettsia mobilis TaxID=1346319 RepID=UPI00292E6034|nr:DVUA0089 family protein [Candidatus Trichorickettsia mobilis]
MPYKKLFKLLTYTTTLLTSAVSQAAGLVEVINNSNLSSGSGFKNPASFITGSTIKIDPSAQIILNSRIVFGPNNYTTVDHWQIHHNGGGLVIDGFDGPDGVDFDSYLYLFSLNSDGSIGTLIADDDDSGEGYQSKITQNNLPAGDYIISIGAFELSESEARDTINDYPNNNSSEGLWVPQRDGDYILNLMGDTTVTKGPRDPQGTSLNGYLINVDIPNVEIRAININGTPGKLMVNENLSLGSVVDNSGIGIKIPIVIAENKILALTGKSSTIIEYGFDANPNDYSAVESINYDNKNGLLKISSTNSSPILLNNRFLNAVNGNLQIITPLTVTDSSIGNIGKVNIGTASSPSTLTVSSADNISIPNTAFNNSNSILVLDSTNVTSSTITLTVNLGGQIYDDNTGVNTNTDLAGIIRLNANNKPLTLTAGTSNKSLGIDLTYRLKELQITGNAQTNVDSSIFSKQLTFNTSAPVRFNQPVALGANGVVALQADTKLIFDSSAVAAGAILTAADTAIGGSVYDVLAAANVDTDLAGIIQLNANNNPLTISVGSLGVNDSHRLKELQITGNAQTNVDSSIFSKQLTFNTSAPVRFNQPVALGANGVVALQADTKLIFDSSAVAAGAILTAADTAIGGSVYDVLAAANVDTDLAGIIQLNANNNPLTISAGSLGVNDSHRLKELQITGNAQTNVNSPIFSKQLTFNTSAPVRFNQPVALGANGVVALQTDTKLIFDSSAVTAGAILTAADTVIGGRVYDVPTAANVDTDLAGIIQLNANNNPLTISAKSFGVDDSHRLKELQITGNAQTNVNLPIFSKQLTFNTSAPVSFNQPVSLGVNGVVALQTDTKLIFDSSAVTAGAILTAADTVIGGRVYDVPTAANVDTDLAGIIQLNANNNPLTISAKSFGVDDSHRLKELQITGNAQTNVNSPIFSKQLTFNTSAPVCFNQPVALGANGVVTLLQDVKIHDLVAGGSTISGISPTVNLRTNELYQLQ